MFPALRPASWRCASTGSTSSSRRVSPPRGPTSAFTSGATGFRICAPATPQVIHQRHLSTLLTFWAYCMDFHFLLRLFRKTRVAMRRRNIFRCPTVRSTCLGLFSLATHKLSFSAGWTLCLGVVATQITSVQWGSEKSIVLSKQLSPGRTSRI